ncbi:hypothetical protein K431DRAFT_83855 [Polychaeton citri CBS 116435]|uniref:Elongin-A n=1 Tax=Polychaeton citri CBS 116435 TaxID=1314669 RepID=A0A9P4Q9S4_9PEZI|nr:hypothetical protein K431DRAFT_83855 [Polychaeton citri CBS 116435]
MADVRRGADSLVSMAQRACIGNVRNITDFGDMPFELIEPILRRVEDPDHLIVIQNQNPGLADNTAHLWRNFIKRDIPNWEARLLRPKNPQLWWKVYRKLEKEEQKRKADSEAQLLAKMKELEQKKESNKTTFINQTLRVGPKIPQVYYEGQERPRARASSTENTWSTGGPGTGSRALKKAKTGSQMMKALRQQSNAASKQRTMAEFKVRAPTGNTSLAARTQIVAAPKGMVMDKMPVVPRSTKSASSHPSTGDVNRVFPGLNRVHPTAREQAMSKTLDSAVAQERAVREDRLRRLTAPGAKASTELASPARHSPPTAHGTSTSQSPPPTTQPIRKRPAANAFMPSKKCKVAGR